MKVQVSRPLSGLSIAGALGKDDGRTAREAARMVIKRREARDRCRGRCGTVGEENRVPIHARCISRKRRGRSCRQLWRER
jgi:hypothetical protein